MLFTEINKNKKYILLKNIVNLYLDIKEIKST